MPDINNLNLVVEEEELPDTPVDELPRQIPAVNYALPQPERTYEFQLPAGIHKAWETMDTQRGQRVKLVLRDEHALVNLTSGGPLSASITTAEREAGRQGEKKLASDAGYLLQALGETSIPAWSNSRAWITRINAHAGESFLADVDWDVSCGKDRNIRRWDPLTN